MKNKQLNHILIVFIAISVMVYSIAEMIGLYQIYQMLSFLFDSLPMAITYTIGKIVLRLCILSAILLGLWKEKKWSRYGLYFVVVYYVAILAAGNFNFRTTMLGLNSSFEIAYYSMLGYFIVLLFAACMYAFYPQLRGKQEEFSHDLK